MNLWDYELGDMTTVMVYRKQTLEQCLAEPSLDFLSVPVQIMDLVVDHPVGWVEQMSGDPDDPNQIDAVIDQLVRVHESVVGRVAIRQQVEVKEAECPFPEGRRWVIRVPMVVGDPPPELAEWMDPG